MMYTGLPWYSLSARMAAPPRSGPVASQRLPEKCELITLSLPPRAKMAPPPPPSKCFPVELPWANVIFCTTSLGLAWSWQCDVVNTWCGSQVSMYRIRRTPPPLSVTFPPPSRTTRRLVLRTFAVARITMVTGPEPQEKVMTPPARTARTTAREVQLAAVPLPTTRSGCAVLASHAAALLVRAEPARAEAARAEPARSVGAWTDESATRCGPVIAPHAEMPEIAASAASSTVASRMNRMGPHASPGTSDHIGVLA